MATRGPNPKFKKNLRRKIKNFPHASHPFLMTLLQFYGKINQFGGKSY